VEEEERHGCDRPLAGPLDHRVGALNRHPDPP
jgi:hypothetical protein